MSLDTLMDGPHPVKLWTPRAEVEATAMEQLQKMAKLPWVFRHIAVMPDVHWGMGCTVGSVIATKEAIAPAAVGVDIGCGMGAIRTNLVAADLPDSLAALRSSIEAAIPVGFNAHAEECTTSEHLSDESHAEFASLMGDFGTLDEGVKALGPRANKQVGTLGGGNHFIELCLDTDQRVWMMLHSGSRNIGKSLAEIHIARAKKLAHNAELPDKDLAVFLSGTPEMEAYRRDL
jgi:tRNA-splicing ligase RtcB